MHSISTQFCVRWSMLEVSLCCYALRLWCLDSNVWLFWVLNLQGIFWNHKVLPCMVEKCGNYLSYFICVSFSFSFFWQKENIVLSSLRIILLLVQPCNNPDCWYLHDFGSQEDSFTKDELLSAFERYMRGAIPHIFCTFEISNRFQCVHYAFALFALSWFFSQWSILYFNPNTIVSQE